MGGTWDGYVWDGAAWDGATAAPGPGSPLAALLAARRRRAYAPPPTSEPVPPPEAAPYRDRKVLRLIADLLAATGEFDEVRTTGPPEQTGATAADAKLACLELRDWDEQDQSNDYNAVPQDHTARFTLLLLVRNQDPDTRDDEIDRLANVCANTINGVSIGGFTFGDWTRLRRGAWQPAAAPERRMTIQGQFAYQVSDFGTHDTTP